MYLKERIAPNFGMIYIFTHVLNKSLSACFVPSTIIGKGLQQCKIDKSPKTFILGG